MNGSTHCKVKRERNEQTPLSERSWESWGLLIRTWLPYGTLGIALVLAWIQPGQSWREYLETTLLTVLAAAWVTLLYLRAPERWSRRSLRMVIYFTGFLAFSAALMMQHPIFFLFAVTGFFHASDLRPWPLVFVGVGLTSALINTIITGFPWPERESWIFFGALIVFQTAIIGFGNRLGEKLAQLSEQRRQAVASLEEALEENAALQAQLVTQAREAGVLEERQRLAQEIHDTLAQGLVGIITQLGAASQAEANSERRQRRLDIALHLARESLAEARRSVRALRPGALLETRLPEALGQTAREWSTVHDMEVDLQITGEEVALSPELEAALLRVAQEALANVAKHAQATRAGITLSYMGDIVTLDIRDDGQGFEVTQHQRNGRTGYGLTSMRDRMREVGGLLTIESDSGGTALSARAPLRTALQEAGE